MPIKNGRVPMHHTPRWSASFAACCSGGRCSICSLYLFSGAAGCADPVEPPASQQHSDMANAAATGRLNPFILSPFSCPENVVPGEGFEPPTFGLQNRCTATVLTRQVHPTHLPRRRARGQAFAPPPNGPG